jgi:hypothetical protein
MSSLIEAKKNKLERDLSWKEEPCSFLEGEKALGLHTTSELLLTSGCSVLYPLNKEKCAS